MMEFDYICTNKAPKAIGPYSQAVRSGEMVFLSGQIPIDPKTGTVVAGGIRIQVKQVLENFKSIVEATGSTLNNVIKTTIFITDMSDFNIVNEIYGHYFEKNYPARSCVEVSRLPKDVLVEIEGVLIT